MRRTPYLVFCLLGLFALSSCSGIETEAVYPADRPSEGDIYTEAPTIWGDGGLDLFKTGKDKDESRANGIGVNSYLWRASLDTISFIPLASADPFGGVIITDWYSPPESPNERVKLNVFIFSQELRADAIQVKVYSQARNGNEWRDLAASKETALKLEDTILTRARQLRVAK